MIWHIVGDIHGFTPVLLDLLVRLGYSQPASRDDPDLWIGPPGCVLVSVGDAVDRGFDSLGSIRVLRRMVEAGTAMMVLGNHEWRLRALLRAQLGLEPVPHEVAPSRKITWLQLLGLDRKEKEGLLRFVEGLPCCLSIDKGKARVVHARWEPRFARMSGESLVFACAFGRSNAVAGPMRGGLAVADSVGRPLGDSTFIEIRPGDLSLPDRAQWMMAHPKDSLTFWGHQVVVPGAVVRIGNTINVESGCFQGEPLSAYVYPTGQVVQAPNNTHWRAAMKPLLAAETVLFPHSIDDVAFIVGENKIEYEADYLAWVEMESEIRGVRQIPDSIVEAHRQLYRRLEEANGSTHEEDAPST